MMMELRHIRYFLAVAEEGHFTRAAARLGIGQPPLSQQIRDLETEIGARLFHRVPHGAELTEAGEAFRHAVQGLPAQVAAAVRQAQKASRGETGALRIGFTATSMFNPDIPNHIRAFRRTYPEVDLTLEEGNSTGLALAVVEGRLDIAFLRPEAISDAQLRISHLPDEPLIAALPVNHRLAVDTGPIPLADMRNEPFVITPRDIGTGFFVAISSMLSLVAAEFGVALVPLSMRQFAVNGVVFREIRDAVPRARLALAYAKSNRSVSLRNFLSAYHAPSI
jgi:DNA-binding transcriptional LysR family regulator